MSYGKKSVPSFQYVRMLEEKYRAVQEKEEYEHQKKLAFGLVETLNKELTNLLASKKELESKVTEKEKEIREIENDRNTLQKMYSELIDSAEKIELEANNRETELKMEAANREYEIETRKRFISDIGLEDSYNDWIKRQWIDMRKMDLRPIQPQN